MRTEGDFIKVNEWLMPLSWLYGVGVLVRNKLFDLGVLKQKSYSIPVISVGNITVGGSGKTPHVEYLVNLLKDRVKTAVLSRGYKRKSKGYILADRSVTMSDIGDEPFQMARKFDNVYVAVDRDRRNGINRLTGDSETSDVDVILLDDAFQHRYVKPGINILLVDYHRLIIYDKLLPAGRLREPMNGKARADMVIITKCPKDLKPMEFRVLTKAMDLYPYQDLFFTTIEYGELVKVWNTDGDNGGTMTNEQLKDINVMLLTGIASPKQMVNDLSPLCKSITMMAFGDHHAFCRKDADRINEMFATMPLPRIIITTEKDAVRLEETDGLAEEVRNALYVQPICVRFMLGQEEDFNNKIISYVHKNSRNSILAKGKNDHKPKDSDNTGHRPGTISFRDN